MKAIKVKFLDSKYNYITSISDNASIDDARNYFVGISFGVDENTTQTCIDIEEV